jgi:hypothetical protein
MGGHLHAPLRSRPSGPADRYVLTGARDRHEQDAHRAARHFTAADSMPPARPPVRPVAEGAIDGLVTAPPSVRYVLNESGDPLESAVRERFERHFSHDFSRVRVHTGPAAAQSAHEIDARAYSAGRDIVFGVSQYAPGTPAGRHLLAHELSHVIQQRDAADRQVGVPIQRFSLSDALELGAGAVAGTAGATFVHVRKQAIEDLIASVRESPKHVVEFFKDEVWEQIKAHWVRVVLISAGLMAAEYGIGALAAAPEPVVTKVIAAILELIVIAVLGFFAGVEVAGAYEEGRKWVTTATEAHGKPEAISEASRAFVRMVWHIVMAVLVLAGVRARIRGITPGGAAAGAGGDVSAGADASASGGAAPGSTGGPGTAPSNVIPFRSRVQAPAEPPPPSASAFGRGGTARQLAPAEAPQVSPPPQPAPPPAPASATAGAASKAVTPGVQPVPAVAAGLSSAGLPKQPKQQRPPFVLRLPQEKAPHLAEYRAWLGRLQSDPAYDRGSPAQLEKWHQAHRIGGSHGIPAKVYNRGHALGLAGTDGERLIRVPNWSRTRMIPMEVDHIIELQVTPAPMRDAFDSVFNYELLDRTSNGQAGNRLRQNIAAERAKQVAYDPSAANRVLIFDQIVLDGGQRGERWSSENIRHGKQLDAYRGSPHHPTQ